jgi:adenosylhomocysteine nucleosidase
MADALGLLAALRRECNDILKWKGWRPMRQTSGIGHYEREENGHKVRLVISGVGLARAKAGLNILLEGFHPNRLISLGYAGGLDPTLKVGDIVVGKRVLLWDGERERMILGLHLDEPPKEVLERLQTAVRYTEGFLVSVDRLLEKAHLRRHLGSDYRPAAVEMETYALSQILRHGVATPLVGLRAISDEFGFEIAHLDRFLHEGRSRAAGAQSMWKLILKPETLRLLAGLYRRSRLASRSLAKALRIIMDHWLDDGGSNPRVAGDYSHSRK